MEKKIVVTACTGVYAQYRALTEPYTRDYAKRIGASYYCMDSSRHEEHTPHYVKFDLFEYINSLRRYTRILYVDIDVYIRRGAWDIFSAYKNAAFNEIPHPDPDTVKPAIDWIHENLDPEFPGTHYYNTGVIVMDNEYLAKLCEAIRATEPKTGIFWEQDQLNVLMRQVGFPQQNLDLRWNQPLGPRWFTEQRAAEAYFLHANDLPDQVSKFFKLKDAIKNYP